MGSVLVRSAPTLVDIVHVACTQHEPSWCFPFYPPPRYVSVYTRRYVGVLKKWKSSIEGCVIEGQMDPAVVGKFKMTPLVTSMAEDLKAAVEASGVVSTSCSTLPLERLCRIECSQPDTVSVDLQAANFCCYPAAVHSLLLFTRGSNQSTLPMTPVRCRSHKPYPVLSAEYCVFPPPVCRDSFSASTSFVSTRRNSKLHTSSPSILRLP